MSQPSDLDVDQLLNMLEEQWRVQKESLLTRMGNEAIGGKTLVMTLEPIIGLLVRAVRSSEAAKHPERE